MQNAAADGRAPSAAVPKSTGVTRLREHRAPKGRCAAYADTLAEVRQTTGPRSVFGHADAIHRSQDGERCHCERASLSTAKHLLTLQ